MSASLTADVAPPQARPVTIAGSGTQQARGAPQGQEAQPASAQRRAAWAADFFRIRGWKGNTARNEALKGDLDKAAATLLRSGSKASAAALAAEKLDPGQEFKAYLKCLAAFEQARDGKGAAALKAAAEAYVAHYDKHSSSQKKQPKTLRKHWLCQQTLADLDLLSKVGGLGDPPWSSLKAMQAATFKAELDFRSLPLGGQKAEGLGADKGVNSAFWVSKASGDPSKPDKTYLFKPTSTNKDRVGVPEGGEPAREALTGRAAEVLNGMTGIDFRVPDTQIVSVERRRFAGVALKDTVVDHNGSGPLVGSLQQFAASKGELRDNSPALGRAVRPERCQELAILDIVTMHVDRHSGNFMLDGDDAAPDLVPIDNGLSFPELPDDLTRMATSHNALLRLPGSHKPFTREMLAKIDKINPAALKAALKKEVDDIGGVHAATKGKVTGAALEQSRRAAMFLKLAAPTLTPAGVQVALGQNAAALFDPAIDDNAFVAKARAVIRSTAQEQGELAEYLTMSPCEQAVLQAECDRLGWSTRDLSPAQVMKVFKSGLPRPAAQDQPAGAAPPTDQEKADMQLAFPSVKVSDKWAAANVKTWRKLVAFGGANAAGTDAGAIRTAIQAAAARISDTDGSAAARIQETPNRALAVLQAQAAADALGPAGAAGDARVLDNKRDLITTLAQILSEPARTQLGQHADRLRAGGRKDGLDGLRDMVTGAAQRDLLKEIGRLVEKAGEIADPGLRSRALADLNIAQGFIRKDMDVITAKQDLDKCKANYPLA